MTYREINCSSCSAVALTVLATAPADELENLTCDCLSCGDRGRVVIREDEGAMRAEFVVAWPHPADRVIDLSVRAVNLFEQMQLDVVIERERQRSTAMWWHVGGTNGEWARTTTNARHAKRCAGWPSGEWQGMKEGGA
jgi:hypothetical protein